MEKRTSFQLFSIFEKDKCLFCWYFLLNHTKDSMTHFCHSFSFAPSEVSAVCVHSLIYSLCLACTSTDLKSFQCVFEIQKWFAAES